DEEGEGPDELGRQPGEGLPLAERLPDQLEIEQLEVAEAPMDELRRPGGRARGEVGLLDEDGGEPARREVARHPRPRHAAPDDQRVDDLAVQLAESGHGPSGGAGALAAGRAGRGAAGPSGRASATSSSSEPIT